MRKEKLRHAVSMMLACVMAISGMAMYFPSCAEEQPEPDSEINTEAISEEAAETEPVKYLVTLPFFDGCSYVYPEENRKEEKENKDIILAYPPGESVEITLIPAEGIRVCEVHVTDCDQAEIGFSFAPGEGKVSFLMPEKDVRLSLVTEEITEETEESTDADEDLPETEILSVSDAETAAGEIPALEEEQTDVSEEDLQEHSLPETEPETDPDGLPLQGSVVMTAPITLPFDTWQFDPETDFTNLTYDESQFTISYVSDDITYDAAGTYSSIYRVTENESGKFWFALRPVLVSEEAETAETESAAGEPADPAEQGTDQADPETAGSDPGEPSAEEEPAEEVTEKETENTAAKEKKGRTKEARSAATGSEDSETEEQDEEIDMDRVVILSPEETAEFLKPMAGSTQTLPARYVFYRDTDFDCRSYQPESDTDGTVVSWEKGELDFSEGIRTRQVITYRAVPESDPEGFWYLAVPFYMVDDRYAATVWSDGFEDRIYLEHEQSDKFSGIVPELNGVHLTGKDITVAAGEDFSLGSVNFDYDMNLFCQSVFDDGGFDPDTAGTYPVVYSFNSYEDLNITWYIDCMVTVVDEIAKEGCITVHVSNGELAAEVTDSDGSVSAVSYGADFITENSLREITVKPAWIGYEDIAPVLAVLKNGEEIKKEGIIASEAMEGSALVITIDPAFEKGNDTWLFRIDFPDYDPTHGGMQKADDRRYEGFANLQRNGNAGIALLSSTTTTKSWAGAASTYASSLSNGSNRVTNYGWSSNFTGYKAWDFNFSSSFKKTLDSWVTDTLGAEFETGSVPSKVRIYCAENNGQHMAYSGSLGNIGYVSIIARAYKNGDGEYYKLNISVYCSGATGTYQGNYQDFSGSATVKLAPGDGDLTIIKKSDSDNFIKKYEQVALTTKFEIATDKNFTNIVEKAAISRENEKDTTASRTISLDPGKYYIRESKRASGHVWNETVYTIEIEAGDDKSLSVVNNVFYFNDIFLHKVDGNTKTPLEGAVYKVAAVSSADNSRIGTWYFKTDKDGYIAYDESHLLSSWNGHESDKLIKCSDTQKYALPIRAIIYAKEVEAPADYVLDSTMYDVTPQTVDNYTTELKAEPIEAENVMKKGYLVLTKESDNPSVSNGNALYSLAGATYAVKDSSGKTAATLKTDEHGNSNTAELEVGTYTVKETEPSPGFLLDTTTYTVEIRSEETTMVVPPRTKGTENKETVPETSITHKIGTAVLKDTDFDTDMPLDGAQFEVKFYAGKSSAEGSAERTWILESDEDGTVGLDSSHFISGSDFYHDNSGSVVLPLGFATVKETKAPAGYKVSDETVTYTMTASGVKVNGNTMVKNQPVIKDEPAWGGLIIDKRDSGTEDGMPQGDAVLAGAVYSVINMNPYSVSIKEDKEHSYAPGAEVMQLVTDENGHAESGVVLQYGTYDVVEIAPPAGYTPEGENTHFTFTIKNDGEVIEYTVKNRVILFDIELVKFKGMLSSEDAGDDPEPIEGAVFGIYLASTDELVLTITTNEEGVATTADPKNYPYGRLPYGTYTIRELEYPEGLLPVEDFTVTGEIDGKTYNGIYKNDQPIESGITVVKVDAETGKTIPASGTELQILDADHQVVPFNAYYPHYEQITNFVTDNSGSVTLPSKLPYGTYYLHEVSAPYGYVLAEDIPFEVKEYNAWPETIMVELPDMPQKGQIMIHKYDELDQEVLSGAVFAVFADEDVTTPDGTIRYVKDQLIEMVTTEEDGTARSSELYPGAYCLQEIRAPEGFCLDDSRIRVILEYEDQEIPVVTVHQDVENRPTTVRVLKKDTDDQLLAGVTFHLINTALADSETDASFVSGDYTTDEDGLITENYLQPGTYEIKETETLPGYVPDDTARYVTVDENGFIFESDAKGHSISEDEARSDTVTLTWVNDYTKMDITKVDMSGSKEVPGAALQVLNNEGNLVEEWISTEEPHRINRLPAGDYTLVETAAPDGYVPASSISFTVLETGEVQSQKMIDKQVFVVKTDTFISELAGAELEVRDENGNVADAWTSDGTPHAVTGLVTGQTYTLVETKAPDGYAIASDITFTVSDDALDDTITLINKQVIVHKMDVTGEKELSGANLTVTDQSGAVVDEWISADEPHPVSNIRVEETYTLTEVLAPAGYALASDMEFTVIDDGVNQDVAMVDEVIHFTVSKKDFTDNKELPGAILQIYNADWDLIDEWISSEKPHGMNLAAGRYTLVEKTAPEGFATAESIEFVIDEDQVQQQLTMYDAPLQVEISKKDITDDEELPGAHLTIKDADGNVVDDWTSTNEPHVIYNLPAGTYTLTEVTAPEGYEVAESVPFTVEDDCELQHVTMYDSPKEGTVDLTGKSSTETTGTPPAAAAAASPAPESGSGPVIASSVKTGDVFRYIGAVLLIGCGGALLAVLYLKKKKRK